MRAATIHSQVHQMPRSDRARRSTARPYDSTVVLSCMALRLFDNSDALLHCGGLHLRLDIYVRFGRPLGSGQLGRGTLAGRGTACVRALLVHGSFAVQRLQVRMTTVEPMSVCV